MKKERGTRNENRGRGPAPSKTTSSKSSDGLHDVVAQIRKLAKAEVRKELEPAIAGIRIELDNLESKLK